MARSNILPAMAFLLTIALAIGSSLTNSQRCERQAFIHAQMMLIAENDDDDPHKGSYDPKYDPGKYITDDPHGPDPHGADTHDEVHDPNLPANKANLPADH